VSGNNLNRLVELMPTLGHLLFGHPEMQQKKRAIGDGGMRVVQIPEGLGVTRDSFMSLMICALELGQTDIPEDSGEREALLDTSVVLGGCERLNELLSLKKEQVSAQEERLERAMGEVTTMEADVDRVFEWRVFVTKVDMVSLESVRS